MEIDIWMARAVRAEGALMALRNEINATKGEYTISRKMVNSIVASGLEYYDVSKDIPQPIQVGGSINAA